MAVTATISRGPRRRERLTFLLLAVAFGVTAAIATAGPGVTATSNHGPITVTASPTEGLADGQHVAIHADAAGGAQIFELRAHLCQHDAGIDNTSEFGFQGPSCPNGAVGAGQFDESVQPPSGATSADLAFAVGMGGVTWLDEQGYVHSLTCGPGNPCDLVVEVQVTNDTVFATFPLLIGEGAPPPPPPPSTAAPAPPPGGGSTGPSNASPVADAPAKGSGASGPGAGKLGDTKVAAAGAATAASAARADAKQSSGKGVVSTIADAVEAAIVGEPEVSQGVRVLCSGLAGVIGGAMVVMIVVRGRRRMQAQVA